MDSHVDKLLKDLEALRIDVDVECQYCDPTGVLRDKYEYANEMLDSCLSIIKEFVEDKTTNKEMTNEEAIARIREHKIVHKMNEPRAIYISEALDMAIKALEQESCEDAISRQAVLAYIDKMPSELTADGRRMIRRRTLEEYISDTLLSVTPQPKIGHWIKMPLIETGQTYSHKCSACGRKILTTDAELSKFPYCHCGAKMREVDE